MTSAASQEVPRDVSGADPCIQLSNSVERLQDQMDSTVANSRLVEVAAPIANSLPRLVASGPFVSHFLVSSPSVQANFSDRVTNYLRRTKHWDERSVVEVFYPLHGLASVLWDLYAVWGAMTLVRRPPLESPTSWDAMDEQFKALYACLVELETEISIKALQWEVSRLSAQQTELTSVYESKLQQLETDAANVLAASRDLEVTNHRLVVLTSRLAERKLVGRFEGFRNGHRWGYGLFLGGALALMGVGAFLAFSLSSETLNNSSASAFSYPDLIWRITLVTGILGIATYMARQAGQHRTLATWASSICVQLQTFDAYTEQVGDPDQINLLRAEFAKRVFGSQPQLKGEPDQAAGTMDLLPLISAIAKAAKTDGTKSA